MSLKKNSYLLLHGICCPENTSVFISTRARDKNGILILNWLCLILCSRGYCLLVMYIFLSYLRLMWLLVLCKGLSILESIIKQEVLDMCCLYCSGSFVFELRRCVGIRMCNSNTPIKSSISYFITRLARPHIGVLICRREKPIIVEYVFVCLRT